jgi:hypothetical protein
MHPSNLKTAVAVVAATAITGISTHVLKEREAGRLRADHQAVEQNLAALTASRDAVLATIQLREEQIERLETDVADLPRLRGEVDRLRRELAQAQSTNPARAVGADDLPVPIKAPGELRFKHPSFTFARVRYSTGTATARRGGGGWLVDYPDADLKFTARFQEVTGLNSDTNGIILDLTDPKLRQQPFIYLAEPGGMKLNSTEIQGLREYLLGGGFLMVDDFWGEHEWQSLKTELARVFPDREPVELSLDHEIFRSFYELRVKPQVPNVATGIESQVTGVTWEREDAREAHYRGLLDDTGRLMAVFCHNTDLADGWENDHASEYYHREFSLKKAYPMGINIVVYALTH